MWQCDDSNANWVCGVDPSDCTNTFSLPVGYIDDNRDVSVTAIVALPSVYTAATATQSGAASTGGATVTMTVTVTASLSNFATSKSSNTSTVGLGAGLGGGLPLLAALFASLFLLYRTHMKLKSCERSPEMSRSQLQSQTYPLTWQPQQEADSGHVHEAPSSRP